MDSYQDTITYYKPETINISGVQFGKEKIADEILEEKKDSEILDTRYILCNAKNHKIVAVIKRLDENDYMAQVDCRYKSFREWDEILMPAGTSVLPKKISPIKCIGDKDYFNRFKDLLECEIDTIDSQLRGLPGAGTKWPKRIEAKKKLFPHLGDYEI